MSILYKTYFKAAKLVETSDLTGADWQELVLARNEAAKRWCAAIIGNANCDVCAGEWAAAMRTAQRMGWK